MEDTDHQVPAEKVYVAVGNDLQEGLGSLGWALRNLLLSNSQSISIVILHVNNTSKDFVYTPFGKLPSSAVNDEMLGIIRMCEQEKIDKLLSKFIAFCTTFKVQAEVLKIEKSYELIHNVIVGLMSTLRITKLVMGITFMKSLSWKGKSSIGGSFYVHKNKPDFCELFIICGGKLVLLREENDEGIVGINHDDQNKVMVSSSSSKMRDKGSIKGWFGKMLTNNNNSSANYYIEEKDYAPHVAPSVDRDWWENYAEEIENYFQLLSSNLEEEEEENCEEEDGEGSTKSSPSINLITMQDKTEPNTDVSDKIATVRAKIVEAQMTIEEKRNEAKADVERRTKAERIISLCDRRAEELEARTNKEITDQIDLKRELEAVREELHEISNDINENKSRVKTISELQSELAKKHQCSSIAKSSAESQLENAVTAREETLQDIDRFRSQKDVLRRRIDFCREIEAINLAPSINLNYNYREFQVDEIRAATNDFSECMRLKSRGGVETSVFKGRLNHTSVAIKYLQNSLSELSQEEFQSKMALLFQLRHPNVITMIGACFDPKCIILEYIQNGCLKGLLLSAHSNRTLSWATRIRIASEIFSSLGFLHSKTPRPIIHGNLNLSNILLDHNLVVKITNFQLEGCEDESTDLLLQSDISAFGVIMLQLLTGREEVIGLVEEVTRAVECGILIEVLEVEMAREWPLDLADEFVGIALRCVHNDRGNLSTGVGMNTVMRELEEMMKKAEQVVMDGGVDRERYCSDVPNIFLCPIYQDIMKNPHVAADGFTYELEAIEEWIATGSEMSPMTNMKLKHKLLTPNHTLRSLIYDWNHHSPSSSSHTCFPKNYNTGYN